MIHDWTHLSRSQRLLIAELAVSLASKLNSYETSGLPKGYFHDEGATDFEDAAELLNDLSVSVHDEITNNNTHKFLKASEIRTAVLGADVQTGPALNQALAVYINFFASYCSKELRIPTERSPFVIDDRYHKVMAALCDNGYVLQAGELFSWTHKISHVMYALEYWKKPASETASEFNPVHPESIAFISDAEFWWENRFRRHALLLTDTEFLTYMNRGYGFTKRMPSNFSHDEVMAVLREVHLYYQKH